MAGSWQQVYDRLPVSFQELAVDLAGWRSYRNRFGSEFRRILETIRRSDFSDEAAIRIDQERRLRETVRWATETVPYYRRLFRDHGIDPSSTRTLEDLSRIPFLEKDTLRHSPELFRSEAVPLRKQISGHSSGTTGTALSLSYTREALAWEYAVIWRQREWYGFSLGDRFAAFGGQNVVPFRQTGPPYWRYDRPRRRMLFSLYHMTPENLAAYVHELARPGYCFWQGYPSSLGLVAQHMLDTGVRLGSAAPRAVFPSSETLLDFHRERIEDATDAVIADRYGNSEFSVSALQCPHGSYHVDTEFGIVEIDPHQQGDGWVRGEVISTGFCNRAMPLIRYRTGDVATILKDYHCACGRSRPVIREIDGRIEDYIITPDGRRVGRMDHVFKDTRHIREAQIHQIEKDEILVYLVPADGFGDAQQRELERQLQSRLGTAMRIRYHLVPRISRGPNGKFRAVVSELKDGRIR